MRSVIKLKSTVLFYVLLLCIFHHDGVNFDGSNGNELTPGALLLCEQIGPGGNNRAIFCAIVNQRDAKCSDLLRTTAKELCTEVLPTH